MFSREQIEQVRSAVDIVEVIREFVPSLKASGRSVKGLCPFHSERTPSFHVHPEKGLFKCFGCGESGDVIGFVSKMEQLSFTDSMKLLADRAGIRLETQKVVENREPEGIREKLYRVLEAASKIYEDQLWDERAGATARAYLDERGVDESTRQTFKLGYAASGGNSVFEVLLKKGFPIELCQTAGLVTRSNAGRFYDPMFGRLIFPIFDSFGHVIGFGGRVLPQTKKQLLGAQAEEDGGPKYLNSPETPVFSKGKSLYGLLQAKSSILSSRRAIILEGYMDVIGVYQGGVKNAVATLGTAFTRDHAKVLKRYAGEITAFFDPDEAGEKAAMRSLEPMIQEEFYPKVVMTTETSDPDEIIREKGREFFDGLIEQAPDFLEYVLKTGGGSKDAPLQKKSELALQMLALIGQTPNEILKSEWTARLADGLGLRVESLEDQLRKKPVKQMQAAVSTPQPVPRKRTFPSSEDELLLILMAVGGMMHELDLTAEDFVEEKHRRTFIRMQEQMARMGKISLPALIDEASEAEKEWLTSLTLEEQEFADPRDRRDQLIRGVKSNKARMRRMQLAKKLEQGQASAGEQAEYLDLLRRAKGSTNDTKGMVTK